MTKIMSPRDDAADHVDRRGFLQRSGAAGLLYAFSIVAPGRGAHAAGSSQPIGAFVRIGTDESVTMLVGVSEMGQGIASGSGTPTRRTRTTGALTSGLGIT